MCLIRQYRKTVPLFVGLDGLVGTQAQIVHAGLRVILLKHLIEIINVLLKNKSQLYRQIVDGHPGACQLGFSTVVKCFLLCLEQAEQLNVAKLSFGSQTAQGDDSLVVAAAVEGCEKCLPVDSVVSEANDGGIKRFAVGTEDQSA